VISNNRDQVSADLAHTFEASGPYGFNKDAAPFDEALRQWVTTLSSAALLERARGLVPGALSCGYTGLVMLHGALEQLQKSGREWRGEVLAEFHPTYYGMMVASVFDK